MGCCNPCPSTGSTACPQCAFRSSTVSLQRLNTVHMGSIITQCLQGLQDPPSVGGVCTVCVPDGILWSRGVPDGAVLTASHGQPLPPLAGGLVLQADAVCLVSPVRGSLASRYDGPVQVAALRAQAMPLVTWSDRCEVSRQACAGCRPPSRVVFAVPANLVETP